MYSVVLISALQQCVLLLDQVSPQPECRLVEGRSCQAWSQLGRQHPAQGVTSVNAQEISADGRKEGNPQGQVR